MSIFVKLIIILKLICSQSSSYLKKLSIADLSKWIQNRDWDEEDRFKTWSE